MEKHKVQLLLLLLVRRLKERTLYFPVLHAALALIVFQTIFKALHPAAKENNLTDSCPLLPQSVLLYCKQTAQT